MSLFVFSLTSFFLLIRIGNQDMFYDGVIYASVARNLAEGEGSF